MSSTAEKRMQRSFFKWYGNMTPNERITTWRVYRAGYEDGISRAYEIIKEGMGEDKEVQGSVED
jgi:hypothetical protein